MSKAEFEKTWKAFLAKKLKEAQSLEFPSTALQQDKEKLDVLFEQAYKGLDETSQIEKLSPKEKKTQFQQLLARLYGNDEERYDIHMMWKNPSDHAIANLGPNKIGLFLRDGTLRCKLKEVDGEINLNILLSDNDLKNRLKAAVEQNTAPSPDDRQTLLDRLKEGAHIKRTTETFNIPKGAFMGTLFPTVENVTGHRKAWNDARIFDQIKNPPKLKPTFAQNLEYKQGYSDLLKEYNTYLFGNNLLTGYVKLLLDMCQPYKESTTRIMRGWKFFIAKTYDKTVVPSTDAQVSVPLESGLSVNVDTDKVLDQQIVTIDLKKRALDFIAVHQNNETNVLTIETRSQGTEPIKTEQPIHPLSLDLSINLLTIANFQTNRIVMLNMSHNKLVNLKFLEALKGLTHLDVSGNSIEDITPLGNCTSLEYLDLSSNVILKLVALKDCKQLATLKVNNNKLFSHDLTVFPSGLTQLETLEVSGNSKLGWYSEENYRPFFPNLKTLKS